MELTPRVRQILLILLQEKDAMPIKNLADQIHTSKRTVQRELEYIHYFLKSVALELCSKTGLGIWIEGEKAAKKALYKQLEDQEEIDFSDKSERRRGLMLELLRDREPKKLYYYANLFSVSETTISKDMERLEPWFEQFDLQILRKQGYGVTLEGSERNFRIAIREFIAKYMDKPVLKKLYEAEDSSEPKGVDVKNIKKYYQLLDEEVLKKVGTCFSSIRDSRIRRLTEESYIGLILHVTIAIQRLKDGETIESASELLDQLKREEDYQLALLIVESLRKEFDIEIPESEVAFICLHIKGSKLQRVTSSSEKDEISPEYQEEIKEWVQGMIVAYDEQLACVLGADEEFVTGLAVHLRPTLVRLRNQLPIENPHLEEIKEAYPEVFKRCTRVGKFLEATLGYNIPESEIGFLAIHFGAALVRMENEKEKKRTVNIGLVCASGIGISRLMASKLQNYLKARVKLITYGKSDLTPFVIQKNDFFVSSMELEGMEVPVLQVNPLLPHEDLLRIDEMVRHYETLPKKREEHTDFAKQMEKVNDLAAVIKEILRNFFCIEVEQGIHFSELLQEVATRITPYKENQARIIQGIKKREEMATQVIPELGIALLHARVNGIFQMGFYVCVPQKHGGFSDPYMQQVKAAVMMLLPEDAHKQENSKLFGYLSESLIEDEKFLQDIQSGNEMQIKATLSRLLKQYFNQYLENV